MENRQLTDIERLLAALYLIGARDLAPGETGVRITVTPLPAHTPDAYMQVVTADVPTDVFAEFVAGLQTFPVVAARLAAERDSIRASRQQMELGADQ